MSLFWVDGVAKTHIELLIYCFELRHWQKQAELPNKRKGKLKETFAPWWQRFFYTPGSWQVSDGHFSLTVWSDCKQWMFAEHGEDGAVVSARGTSRLVRRFTTGNEHLYITDQHRVVIERLLA